MHKDEKNVLLEVNRLNNYRLDIYIVIPTSINYLITYVSFLGH